MRLKFLELQGYKTFAARTEFAFDGGITAIVGPNGSGKSNIADAIRWVLGEQSYRTLRGKRTEDMIFSGSAMRARLGMASASLTLDNADGWLPTDFGEVTITRRAYRSGENEYVLNGKRVRLRDITELLSKSGLAQRTYTVVGQGLVDDVLSLRAEDRRALFEEAAGVSLYQAKRADALSRLEETRSNLLRVNDIINEIAPRLRRLEREAERAERYALLSQQLSGLLRTWYGYRWRQEQLDTRRTRDALERREATVMHRREALEALDERMAGLRVRQSQLRGQLGGWHRESGELHRQMEAVQRDLAVWQERARLLARQTDEHETELADLTAQAQVTAEHILAAQQVVADCQAALREKENQVSQAQADLEVHEERRAGLSGQMADAQARVFDLATQISDRRNRLAQVEERRAALEKERADHQATLADQQAHAGQLSSEIQAVVDRQAGLEASAGSLADEAAQLEAVAAEAQARQTELGTRLAEAQQEVERLEARYDLLTRLREEGEGLHAGVRAVLLAAKGGGQAKADLPGKGSLGGIMGTVAQLLQVPADYEVAVEAALGGHWQDIVVESWPDAEAAIAYLRAGKRGRATFLPLDTARPQPQLKLPKDSGIVGRAADLVRAEARLRPVVEMLLGRTILVHNLRSARQVFEQLRGGFQIVTLAGEVLRSSGSVTGGRGRGQAQGQVLAREREWRELPRRVETARGHSQESRSALAEAQATEGHVREQMAALAGRQREAEEATAQLQEERRKLERDLDRDTQQIAWRQGLVAQLDEEARDLEAAQSSLGTALGQLTADRKDADAQLATLQEGLDELRGEVLYQRLSEARTEGALAQGRWENRRAALDGLRDKRAQLQAQMEAKRQRIADLEGERSLLSKQIADQASQEAVIQGWLAALAQKIEPAEAEVARLETERESLEREEAALRTRLRRAEGSQAQALLTRSRQEDRLERLRRQIMDDFGLVEMEPVEGMPEQLPLPFRELVSALPMVETLPEGLEQEIHQIKAQMKRMGSINPLAPDEHAEVLDRYTFLTTQATDLEEAARSLREVITELDEVMRREFLVTFKAIATRFEQSFTKLFGGGTARLVLTEPDNVSQTGVEIVARPPGKRQQTLALLSGGERSLTAAALIFSILEVSPPPFCVLDEVDAMLDEANVKRFRQELEGLAEKTQFIIITHNRGTVQAANTIYGVSMGEDSVSQVVSLRMEGERIATLDGAIVNLKDG